MEGHQCPTVIIHDLVEAEAGDIPAFDTTME
ncbi:HD domain-containing protein [Rossellomorea sp. FM04394]